MPVSTTNFDTLVTGPNGPSMVGIYTHIDGVQGMVEAFDQNANQLQAKMQVATLLAEQATSATTASVIGYIRSNQLTIADSAKPPSRSRSPANQSSDGSTAPPSRAGRASVAKHDLQRADHLCRRTRSRSRSRHPRSRRRGRRTAPQPRGDHHGTAVAGDSITFTSTSSATATVTDPNGNPAMANTITFSSSNPDKKSAPRCSRMDHRPAPRPRPSPDAQGRGLMRIIRVQSERCRYKGG